MGIPMDPDFKFAAKNFTTAINVSFTDITVYLNITQELP
jgi:hypothetical protein